MAKNELKILLFALAGITLYIFVRGWKGAAHDAAGAAINATGGAVAGAAEAIGSNIGVPLTDTTVCELACSNGETLKASAYCSAGRFFSYLKDGK